VSWLKKATPQEQLEARLLKQARLAHLEMWAENLPLEFLLRLQCRHLEATAEANPATMDLSQDPAKLWQRIKKKMQSANAMLAPLKEWLSRRPFLQRLRMATVQLRRRLMVQALCLVLRLAFKVTRSRGTRPPSAPCSKNSLTDPSNPEFKNDRNEPRRSVSQIELSRNLPQERLIRRPQNVPWPFPDPMARRN
jgi:hypothetical protein